LLYSIIVKKFQAYASQLLGKNCFAGFNINNFAVGCHYEGLQASASQTF